MQTYLTLPILSSLRFQQAASLVDHVTSEDPGEARAPAAQHSNRQTDKSPNRQIASLPCYPQYFLLPNAILPPLGVTHNPCCFFPSKFKLRGLTSSCWARARAREGDPTSYSTRPGRAAAAAAPQPTKQTKQTTQDRTSEPKRPAHTTRPPRALSRFCVATWAGSRIRGPASGAGKEGRHLGRRSSRPPLTLGLACSLQLCKICRVVASPARP